MRPSSEGMVVTSTSSRIADFLRRMQRLANYAICQIEKECDVSREDAIESLKCEGHTLAKTLDEYNFMKYTKNCDAVWRAEYEPCNSP